MPAIMDVLTTNSIQNAFDSGCVIVEEFPNTAVRVWYGHEYGNKTAEMILAGTAGILSIQDPELLVVPASDLQLHQLIEAEIGGSYQKVMIFNKTHKNGKLAIQGWTSRGDVEITTDPDELFRLV